MGGNRKKKTSKTKSGRKGGSDNSVNPVRGKGRGRDGTSVSKNDSNDAFPTSLYAKYKKCTSAVFEWGTSSFDRLNKVRGKKRDPCALAHISPGQSSLSVVLFRCLGSLAKAGIPMPDSTLRDLRMAIRYRKQVGMYYRAVPSADERQIESHEWLINQLERLEGTFSDLTATCTVAATEPTATEAHETSVVSCITSRFEFLSWSDEESSDEESSDDGGSGGSDIEGGDVSPVHMQTSESPSQVELDKEERTFAISLVFSEINEVRRDLKELWQKWAKKQVSLANNDSSAAAELLGATACTEYILSYLRKLLLQTSLEFRSVGDFDKILSAWDSRSYENDSVPEVLKVGDFVTLRKLEKRPELNGRSGRIVRDEVEGRYAVNLLPKQHPSESTRCTTKATLSIKPENLVPSDTIVLRLSQINDAMRSFPFDSCPEPPCRVYGSPPSESVRNAAVRLLLNADSFKFAMENQDFDGFLQLLVEFVLPLWVSISRYLANVNAADPVFIAYLHEFHETRQVRFHFALSILFAIDIALAVQAVDGDLAEATNDLYSRVLCQVYDGKTYQSAIDIFHTKVSERGVAAFLSHFEFSRHTWREYNQVGLFFPWISGELLLSGLRMHFVCGSGFPWNFCQQYTALLHLYWALRCEGLIGRMKDIENTLIGMYRQKVWFRSGVPEKGRGVHVKLWQLASGRGARTYARDSRQPKMLPESKLDKGGLMVTEISRLLDALQWKSMPVLERKASFQHLQQIAREEYRSIFTAPLMDVCIKFSRLEDLYAANFVTTAKAFGHRYPSFLVGSQTLHAMPTVVYWGLWMADHSLPKKEKQIGLSLLAKSFRDMFDEEEIQENEDISMTFSLYDHNVDSSFWGEEGARRLHNLHVSPGTPSYE